MSQLSKAAADVIDERRRQIESEGWTPEHDDEYTQGELAVAALCYAGQSALTLEGNAKFDRIPSMWPWSDESWKPSEPRRGLVKAAALILAEIERLDRSHLPPPPGETK